MSHHANADVRGRCYTRQRDVIEEIESKIDFSKTNSLLNYFTFQLQDYTVLLVLHWVYLHCLILNLSH